MPAPEGCPEPHPPALRPRSARQASGRLGRGFRLLTAAAGLALGLGPGSGPLGFGALPAAVQPGPMPDFQLRDANPNSPRSNQTVSPRDYRLQISAFYFGAAG